MKSNVVLKNYDEMRKACQALAAKSKLQLSLHDCPKRFLNVTLNDYEVSNNTQEKVIAIINRFIEKIIQNKTYDISMIFTGNSGTGKTMLAIAIAHKLLNNGHNTLYTTSRDLLRNIKNSYNERTEERVIEKYSAPKLLIIDEIDKGHGASGYLTAAEQNILFEIIDKRYVRELGLIAISNQNLSSLKTILGEPSINRILLNGVVFAFNWQKFQKKHKNKPELKLVSDINKEK